MLYKIFSYNSIWHLHVILILQVIIVYNKNLIWNLDNIQLINIPLTERACNTKWAGNGLNPGQLPWNTMSNNAPDIESFLFGINSTNMVTPQPCLTPELKRLESANIFNKDPVYIPKPLIVENGQRPFPIP